MTTVACVPRRVLRQVRVAFACGFSSVVTVTTSQVPSSVWRADLRRVLPLPASSASADGRAAWLEVVESVCSKMVFWHSVPTVPAASAVVTVLVVT